MTSMAPSLHGSPDLREQGSCQSHGQGYAHDDTPLGRLDIEHRKGVLNHLVQREHQVILLSTNTEVVGEYLREIAPHVQKKYLIHFERVGDIGQSSVSPGYFEEMGGQA